MSGSIHKRIVKAIEVNTDALVICFAEFSTRKPVPTSLENPLTEQSVSPSANAFFCASGAHRPHGRCAPVFENGVFDR